MNAFLRLGSPNFVCASRRQSRLSRGGGWIDCVRRTSSRWESYRTRFFGSELSDPRVFPPSLQISKHMDTQTFKRMIQARVIEWSCTRVCGVRSRAHDRHSLGKCVRMHIGCGPSVFGRCVTRRRPLIFNIPRRLCYHTSLDLHVRRMHI